jgi:hypothetical protein
MSRSGVVGSMVIERTFDGLTLVGLILLLFFVLPETQFLGVAALSTGMFFLALASGILIYSSTVDRTHRAIDKALETLPQKLREFANRRLNYFLKGIRGISTVGGCLEAAGYTALIWTLEISAVALVVISFGVVLPLSGYLLVYALATLGTTLPSGPAYIGQYQYAFVLALSFFLHLLRDSISYLCRCSAYPAWLCNRDRACPIWERTTIRWPATGPRKLEPKKEKVRKMVLKVDTYLTARAYLPTVRGITSDGISQFLLPCMVKEQHWQIDETT